LKYFSFGSRACQHLYLSLFLTICLYFSQSVSISLSCNHHNPPRATSMHTKTRASSSMTTDKLVYAPTTQCMYIHIEHTYTISYTAHTHIKHASSRPNVCIAYTCSHTHTRTRTHAQKHECMRRTTPLGAILRETSIF
jgi:hypothetical protein